MKSLEVGKAGLTSALTSSKHFLGEAGWDYKEAFHVEAARIRQTRNLIGGSDVVRNFCLWTVSRNPV